MDEQVRLYSLLVDQIQRYNSIVWQVPTGLVAADVVALQQLNDRPLAMFGVALVSGTLTFAYYRMVVSQGILIRAARAAEAQLRDQYVGFVPNFPNAPVSSRWLIVAALVLFNVGLVIYAVMQLLRLAGVLTVSF